MAARGHNAQSLPRRIVVKIGSAVIARAGVLDLDAVGALAADISALLTADSRRQVVIVSSGAVASGFRSLGLAKPPKQIVSKQAAAAVGQPRLMQAWASAFAGTSDNGRAVAQVLLTAEDIDHRTRFLNARRTLETLLEAGVVPIINENDSVSFAEIKLGDNDHLSALVASLVSADLLVILSSVAGVWDTQRDPSRNGSPPIVPEILSLADGMRYVRSSKTDVGTGGMETKIKAACSAAALGTRAVIADGSVRGILKRLASGDCAGTHFPSGDSGRATAARKKWIGFSARPKGVLVVDEGARRAVADQGASLLPSGLKSVEGDFSPGALVELHDPDGGCFARGLASYGADDLRALAGKKTSQIVATLGYHYADEAVHRDDLVVMRAPDPTPRGARRSDSPRTGER